MKTAQEVFDTVARYLLTQGRQSIENGVCKYRSQDGTKCAVGCLIPDDLYTKEMEGLAVDGHGLELFPKFREILEKAQLWEHRNLLLDLQWIHDRLGPEHWYLELWNLAKSLDLSTAALESSPKP